MHLSSFVVAAALASGVAAQTPGATCHNITIPVSISARNAVFNTPIPQNSLQVTDFILNFTRQGSNFTNAALTGYATVSGNYNLSATYCTPTNATSTKLQILTHGIGFDRHYWNLAFHNYNYSYVKTAAASGYNTLFYDRLGIGMSSHGEPLNEIQSFLEVQALANLTMQARAGTIPGLNGTIPTQITHVGHSFGSAQTYALVNLYPNISDGIVLTGFSMIGLFVPYFLAGGNFVSAKYNQPLRFGNATGTQIASLLGLIAEPLVDYVAPLDLTILPKPQNLPDGYIISSNAEANKYLFFEPHQYDPAILTLAERTKQPVTLGELLTLGSVPATNAFAKPVLVVTGEFDLPYCGGNCLKSLDGRSLPSLVAANFANVAPGNFSTIIQPKTGHGINLHYNATGAYTAIQGFLKSHAL